MPGVDRFVVDFKCIGLPFEGMVEPSLCVAAMGHYVDLLICFQMAVLDFDWKGIFAGK